MCTYKETVGFSVEEPLFREISALYKDNKEGQWRFRISSKSGDDIDLSLPYAELAAIIERVDLYKSTRR